MFYDLTYDNTMEFSKGTISLYAFQTTVRRFILPRGLQTFHLPSASRETITQKNAYRTHSGQGTTANTAIAMD